MHKKGGHIFFPKVLAREWIYQTQLELEIYSLINNSESISVTSPVYPSLQPPVFPHNSSDNISIIDHHANTPDLKD